ncbi:hypothetical protein PBY51_005356 [Eleginops maclovinus]|uniref:Uncharacterized protein n=1 Tax=Eleginops maclovinus TaxID=56733 RepID=A0AAN8AHC6_ELEMC|nr:hypothetical protein PBY51_005356 [Eleginops maclovinus]
MCLSAEHLQSPEEALMTRGVEGGWVVAVWRSGWLRATAGRAKPSLSVPMVGTAWGAHGLLVWVGYGPHP